MHRFLLSSLLLSLLLFLLCQVNLDLVSMKSLQKMVLFSDETSNANELNKYFVNILQQICKDNKARGGYSHTLPIWVCVAQRGRDFKAPDLEWGIHFRGVF